MESLQWLKDKLLGALWLEDELDQVQALQCPVGFLLNVNAHSRAKSPATATTDFLVYGILSNGASLERPPTPPISSSPSSDEPVTGDIKHQLRVYVAPLSGYLITRAQTLPTPESNDEFGEDGQYAHFLPDLRSPSPKRKRVATLFESVAQHHKRVRQRGGEAVSQLMANSQSSQQLQALRMKREPEDAAGLPSLDRIAAYRARSLSIGRGLQPGKPLELRTESQRPSSNRSQTREFTSRRNTPNPFIEPAPKKGTPNPFLEPALRKDRREGEVFPAFPSSDGNADSLQSKDAESIISDNKNTITRTILTCMRLYGFNRASTRPGTSGKHDSHEGMPPNVDEKDHRPGAETHTDEDEFKSMYHATYRASMFALRKYLKEPVVNEDGLKPLPPLLEKGKAMTYIDEFLRLFCEEN